MRIFVAGHDGPEGKNLPARFKGRLLRMHMGGSLEIGAYAVDVNMQDT